MSRIFENCGLTMDSSVASVTYAQKKRNRFRAVSFFFVVAGFSIFSARAQNLPAAPQNGTSIEGTVQNSAGEPVDGASVVLQRTAPPTTLATKTDVRGAFVFLGFAPGVYTLRAEKPEWGKVVAESISVSAGEKRRISLVLRAGNAGAEQSQKSPGAQGARVATEFADEPSFAVAGITDWSNAGLHASATDAHTSEALAKDTRALETGMPLGGSAGNPDGNRSAEDAKQTEKSLRAALVQKPKDFAANHQLGEFYCRSKRYGEAIPLLTTAFQIDPSNNGNSYDLALAYLGSGDASRAREQGRKMLSQANSAEAHRLLGDLDEQLSDPLGAVREYQQATRMDATEPNYLAWGTELLLHRATGPAVEVFTKGFSTHPDSARLLTGLGAALYASGSYEEAARRLCQASDLKPADSEPYIFLGKMEKSAPGIQPCSKEKLARFVGKQPGNALANYYYGLILWKEAKESQTSAAFDQASVFLEKAVQIDPKFDEAYLQLGILRADRGDFANAISAYQKAIELNPESGEVHYRLAQAYQRTGEAAKAGQEMQTYKEIEQKAAVAREREERELQQFLIIMKSQPANSAPH